MKTGSAQVYQRVSCILGEGPCYNIRNGELSWVDIKFGTLYVLSPDQTLRKLQTGQYLGAAIPTKSGRFIALMTTGIYLLMDDEIESLLDVPSRLELHQRFNDAKCDPMGRLFAGTMPLFMKHIQKGGKLYRYTGGTAQPLDTPAIVPNGMAWSADERTMYLVDTGFGTIDAFDYDVETGIPSNRHTVIKVKNGMPDGMCIDSEDKLWVAIWGAGEVRRYDPQTAEILEVVKVGVRDVSSCCFGGSDLRTLFITTSGEDEPDNPEAGFVYSYQTEVTGTQTVLYNDL